MAETDASFLSYEPSKGHGLPHDPFNAIVGPRPIGWISSIDGKGRVNLAPYSFFNAFNYTPPIVGFASAGFKDTISNIIETKEFVWNLATFDLAKQMNVTSGVVPHEVSEFDLARLEQRPSTLVKPPRVAASPVQFECRLSQHFQLQSAAGKTIETWMAFGEVVAVHIRRDLLENGIYVTAQARPILRAGGPGGYAVIEPSSMFEMVRPRSREELERMVSDLDEKPAR